MIPGHGRQGSKAWHVVVFVVVVFVVIVFVVVVFIVVVFIVFVVSTMSMSGSGSVDLRGGRRRWH